MVAGSPGSREKPDCSSARGTQFGPRGDTHWVSQLGPSPLLWLPQNASHRAEMALPWCPSPGEGCLHPQHQVLVTHSMGLPTWCPEDRPILPPVPALHHQSASVPSLSIPSRGMCHPVPHPKKDAAVLGLCREVLGWGMLAVEMSPNPGNSHHGQDDHSRTSRLWASNSPPRSPRSPRVSCGASAGKSLSG